MLKNLTIDNYLLIDHLEFDLNNQFSVLTGETGAGKSIFINALALLKGERLTSKVTLDSSRKSLIEGCFEFTEKDESYQKLMTYGFDPEEEYIFSREISEELKSVYRINRKQVSLSIVKDILENEIDIHSQFNTQKLLNPDEHLKLLDEYINNKELLKNVDELYKIYNHLKKEKLSFEKSIQNLSSIDEIEHQLAEVEALNPSVEDESMLLEKISQAKQIEHEFEQINHISQFFANDTLADLYAIKNLSDDHELSQLLSGAYFQLEEANRLVESKLLSFDINQDNLEAINERLFEYSKIKRKYKMDTNQLVDFMIESKQMIDDRNHLDDRLHKFDLEIEKAYHVFLEKAKELSLVRLDYSKKLCQEIKKHALDLSLKNLDFEVKFIPSISNTGLETCQFLVSLNRGVDKGPINKVASGGELSRLMLALKVIFNKQSPVNLMIFDEIDTGVSGSVAKQMALKMLSLSQDTKLISVTHLPIVAAYGDVHYLITKSNSKVMISSLNEQSRIEQLALMMSGKVTDEAIELAKQLINQAEVDKSNVS